MSKEHLQECHTTQFTGYQYDFVWKLKNCDEIFSMTIANSFNSKEFLLDKTKQKCSLRLDINKWLTSYSVPNASNVTISVTAS